MAIATDDRATRVELLRVDDQYRPVMMWFWNAHETEREIRRQIGEFQAQGIRDFFIHPAYGAELPYLDEGFMQRVGAAIDEAKQRGMRFWIYDENAWPSGLAGGEVLRDHPEARMRQLLQGTFSVAAGERVEIAQPGEWLVAFALYQDQAGKRRVEQIDTELAEWTNREKDNATLSVFRIVISGGVHPACKWTATTWEQEGSLDVADAEAVRHFLDRTHEIYYKHFGKEFGKTLAGSFTDEPVLSTGWILEFPKPFIGLPWTRRMLETFKAKRGYDLRDVLYKIATDFGDEIKTRYDYWLHITECFAESYGKQMGEWCSEHGIQLTGHINCEEHLLSTAYASGDLYRVLKHFQQPGIDSVESGLYMDMEETVLPPKIISSIVHQTDREKSFCETYTGSGWDMNFEVMKRVFDRLSVLGVDIVQFMGAYYSIKGFRRLPPDAAWPPSHSYQNALWPHYHRFAEYIARVARLNAEGSHAARVGMLYPIATTWTLHRAGHGQLCESDPDYLRRWEILLGTFCGLGRGLLEIQADYDMIFDEPLREARVEGGTISIRDERYTTLILPAATLLEFGILEQLEAFAAQGGRLVFVNALPRHRQDGEVLDARIKALWGFDGAEIGARAQALWQETEPRSEVLQGKLPNVCVLLTNSLAKERRPALRATLQQTLGVQAFNATLSPPWPNVWVQTRQVGESVRICLINEGAEAYAGTLRIEHATQPQLLLVRPDAEACTNLASRREGDALTAQIELRGYDLTFVQTADEPIESSEADWRGTQRITLEDRWTLRPEADNTLRPTLSVKLAEAGESTESAPEGAYHATPDYRFPEGLEPINGTGTGYGQMCGSYPMTGLHMGKTYWVRGEFLLDAEAPRALRLVLEDVGIEAGSLRVNGQALALSPCRVWDEANLAAELTPALRVGKNAFHFRLVIPPWSAPHALPLVAVCGAFEVDAAGVIIQPLSERKQGDWREQGYRDFSGTIRYGQTFEAPAANASQAVRIVVEAAEDVVEVILNGESLGARLWKPFRFDATTALRDGSNQLEIKVTSTSANLFGKGKVSGLLGNVRVEFGGK